MDVIPVLNPILVAPPYLSVPVAHLRHSAEQN